MANKTVKFNTKIINDNKVYLKVSDVAKALRYSKAQDFINEHPSIVEKISSVQCVKETDFNNLLAENEDALKVQGQIEVTKLETLRSKVDSVMGFQGLKLLLARDFLQMIADKTGCASKEEYLVTHEIPKEKRKALQELMQDAKSNSNYQSMVEYLHDKERFDIDKLRSFGLDVQYLVSIDCCGKVDIDAFVVGYGVFCHLTDLGDYASWNDMYIDENGNKILPFYNNDAKNPEDREQLINLSKPDVDHDFREGNVIQNMLWCIENLKVEALEDYEFAVFSYFDGVIDFQMSIELLVKILKPDIVSTIFTDKLIDLETGQYITEFDKEKVFASDFT